MRGESLAQMENGESTCKAKVETHVEHCRVQGGGGLVGRQDGRKMRRTVTVLCTADGQGNVPRKDWQGKATGHSVVVVCSLGRSSTSHQSAASV